MRTEEETKVFLEERKSGIGGSDAAGILGVSKWSSPTKVWSEKMGLSTTEMNESMEWGLRHEATIREKMAELLADRYGDTRKLFGSEKFFRSQSNDFMICHADDMIVNEFGDFVAVVEFKTTSERNLNDENWGETWTDEIPEEYIIQVQHNMYVTETRECYLGVLFGNSKFRIYHVLYNEKLVNAMVDQERAFYDNHILTQTAPDVDGSEATSEALKDIYPKDEGKSITVTEEDEETIGWIRALKASKDEIKVAEIKKTEAENHIKGLMGDASELVGPDFKITWKNNKDGVKIDFKKAIADFTDDDRVPQETKDLLVNILGANTTPVPGARVFRPNLKKME